MRDEEFVFVSDVRDKKRIAHGAHNKRTHCGKGGAVKFPSDYLSRKELKAMNGEVKHYNINSPMKWKEFKALPDDIKIMYIKAIRERFDAPDKEIAKMLGTHQQTFSTMVGQLGIRCGKNKRHKNFDANAWNALLNGNKQTEEVPVEEVVPEVVVPVVEERITEEAPVPAEVKTARIIPVETKPNKVIPADGTMHFEGDIEAALETVRQMLCGAVGSVFVTWNLKGCETE